MDPLSALSIAGNVVQFAQFAFGLLNSSRRIYSSASGLSAEYEDLDTVYSRLSTFSIQLLNTNFVTENVVPGHIDDLQKIAGSCKDDCEKLLCLVERLRLSSNASRRWWHSFSKAILELWKAKDLEQIKARVSEARSSIIYKLCAISCECITASSADLRQLQVDMREAWHDRAQQTKDLIRSFDQLKSKVEGIRSTVVNLATQNVSRNLYTTELELLTEQVKLLALSGKEFTRQNELLQSLDFDKRPMRHERIPEAYEKTFRWIFDPSSSEESTPGKRFVSWLERGHDVFWVTGKPGCGKSTLMKYIADSEETRSFLRRWTSPKKLVLASHYFWSAGSIMQRSDEGLIRSLLFDIFMQIPEVMVGIIEDLQKEAKNINPSFIWSKSNLRIVMLRLAQMEALPARVCLFVDGLDEFDGDHFELSRTLLGMSTSKDIKICLSSRPWNVFEDSFGADPKQKLHLHELTRNDILQFAEKRLYDHPRWSVSSVDQDSLPRLVSEITERAQGVFLWVFLVTHLLREGLSNYDSSSDLMKRLQSVPSDLEMFFKHILSSVEPFYHEKMAGTLSIAIAAKEPLPLPIYSFHEMEYADPDFALKLSVVTMTEQEIQELENTTARRLNGWCKGLVEVVGGYVEFIHRTVRDFLQEEEMTKFLKQKTPQAFDAKVAILRSYWAAVKQAPLMTRLNFDYKLAWYDTFKWAEIIQHGDAHSRDECERLLDDMEKTFSLLMEMQRPLPWWKTSLSYLSAKGIFRELVIEYCLVDYMSRKMAQDDNYLADLDGAPLSIAICTFTQDLEMMRSRNITTFPQKQFGPMFKCLLAYGNDPNEILYDHDSELKSTPWTDFMSSFLACERESVQIRGRYVVCKPDELQLKFSVALRTDLFASFFDYDADLNENISYVSCFGPGSQPIWVIWLFFGFLSPYLQDVQDRYLKDLRRILSSTVEFEQINAPLLYNCVANPKSLFDGEWTNEREHTYSTLYTPWKLLCHHLTKGPGTETLSDWETQQLFLIKIILMLIKLVPKHILSWDQTLPFWEAPSRSVLFSPVLEALGRPVKVIPPNKRRKARRLPSEYLEDTMSSKKTRIA